MEAKQLDALTLRKMFLSGAANLEAHKDYINELNVFPVPDGDTGTNMSLTISSACEAVAALEDPTTDQVTKAISSGSLRGARGNSGVILSQIFRGLHKEIKDNPVLTTDVLARAARRAVETAYKAVMKPKEGTILTVARAMAEEAETAAVEIEDIGEFLEKVAHAGDAMLEKTPELLPVLKEAGVVDSGGKGLMMIVNGAVDAYFGRETVPEKDKAEAEKPKFLYRIDFLLRRSGGLSADADGEWKNILSSLGEVEVFNPTAGTVRVAILTNDPGHVIAKSARQGTFARVDFVNLTETVSDEEFAAAAGPAEPEVPKEWKERAFLAVSVGNGLTEIFKSLGADDVIQGGQTMNPSTDDILTAVERIHARTVFILPNNKNIILAANQAAELASDCRIIVVPTKTIPQGISALVNYMPTDSIENNLETMTEAISHVITGEVTYAVRDTRISGKDIRTGDIMGIGDNDTLTVGTDIKTVALDMLKAMVDEDSEIISLYRGADFSEEDMEALQAMTEEAFPDIDVEVNDGGQPVYYCIASVE